MVLGVSNKLLALMISQLTLQSTGSMYSIGSVAVSIAGAVGFQQTVKGKGLSQVRESKVKTPGADPKGFLALFIGFIWFVWLYLG